jgi:hypothetical protein
MQDARVTCLSSETASKAYFSRLVFEKHAKPRKGTQAWNTIEGLLDDWSEQRKKTNHAAAQIKKMQLHATAQRTSKLKLYKSNGER